MSGGGSPAAVGASRTEDTPHGKRPSSPSGPPTKKQRTDIEKSRDRTIVSSEEEGRGQGFRASGTASGSSRLPRGSREKESQEAINQRKIDKTATVKIKPKPDKKLDPLAKARGSVARELEKREEKPNNPKERDQPDGLYPVLDRPPRSYGYWSGSGREDRPRALILFSGRARPGDLHQSLVRLGWTVCSVDTLSPKPTNLLDDAIYSEIQKDLIYQFYEALWVATPCGTFLAPPGEATGSESAADSAEDQGFAEGGVDCCRAETAQGGQPLGPKVCGRHPVTTDWERSLGNGKPRPPKGQAIYLAYAGDRGPCTS